jgi:S-formylglutathione hydrolase FrmB
VEDRGALLRQGLPGDWRNHFAASDDLACRAIAGEAMARYGYVG